jgi:radical SAM superfamily enzyme YgiQ (UPF0313 family)
MKCVLIIPPWRHCDTHPGALVETIAGIWPPTGLLYIASVLQQDGHDVEVMDGAYATEKEIMDFLEAEPPGFVGISCVYPLWLKAKDLAEKIKARFPDLFLAVGGQGPTFLKAACLEECDAIDGVVVGEGELVIRDILRRLSKGEDYSDIPCTYVRVDNKIIANKGIGVVENLDDLPFPAYELIDINRYRPSIGLFKRVPVLSTFSSRGCPNDCIYCSKIAGRSVRWKSPERIGTELEHYVKTFGVKEIKFFDDLFTFDKERAIQVCDQIVKRKLPLVWSASSRVDTIDGDLVKAMKKAGCWYIHFGVESGVQKNLDTLKKGTTLEQIKHAVALTHEAGISTFTSFIIGIPGETYEEAEETIRFACRLNSLYSEFFCCTPFPGTELHNNIDKYGVLKESIDRIGMHLNSFHPHTLTEEQVEQLRSKAFVSFYFRWRNILNQIKSIKSWKDFKYKLLGARAILGFRKGGPQ